MAARGQVELNVVDFVLCACGEMAVVNGPLEDAALLLDGRQRCRARH